jgi:hypothetical protein
MFPETAKEGLGQPAPGALSTAALAPLEVDHQSLEVGIALLAQTHGVDTLSKIMRPSVLLDRSVLGGHWEDLLMDVVRVCERRVGWRVRWRRGGCYLKVIAIKWESRSVRAI